MSTQSEQAETNPSPEGAQSLLTYSPKELKERVIALGGKAFHAKIAREDLLARGILDYEGMTSLPTDLRKRMAEEIPLLAGRELDRRTTQDGTIKLLIDFPGEKRAAVETVHIPPPRSRPNKGATLCVSSQVGCAVGCPFCASGLAGLVRNLEPHEIVEQYLRGRDLGPLSRSVVMGIGEPLLNYENLAVALDCVHDELGLGARKLTVSTVGFPDRVRKVARSSPRFQLAISLHTPFDDQRDELVPAMKGTDIEAILSAGDDWFEQTHREITYEYVLLGDVNDSPGHAEALAKRLAGRRCMVNLIPYNPSRDLKYRRPEAATVEAFRDDLEQAGLIATVRWSRGLDGDAACGQLRLRSGARS